MVLSANEVCTLDYNNGCSDLAAITKKVNGENPAVK